jgi:hypothetical protein
MVVKSVVLKSELFMVGNVRARCVVEVGALPVGGQLERSRAGIGRDRGHALPRDFK